MKYTTTLNDGEYRCGKHIGRLRYDWNRKKGNEGYMQQPVNPLEKEKQSMLGEIAFCKIFNIYPDLAYDEPKPYDAILHGHTINVKTIDAMHKNLIVTVREEKEFSEYFQNFLKNLLLRDFLNRYF